MTEAKSVSAADASSEAIPKAETFSIAELDRLSKLGKLVDHIDARIDDFEGNSENLSYAIGLYFIGRRIGWKPLYLVSDKRTIAKAEQILALDFRKELPEVGPKARKSMAWRLVEGVKSFWRAVRGDYPGVRSGALDNEAEAAPTM